MDYLTRISNTFYLRLPVPKDLQAHYSRKEIKQSLYAKKKAEARVLLPKLFVQYQQKFFQLRTNTHLQQERPSKKAIEIWLKKNP